MADRFEYAVEGVGDFPLDMLRHDRAYPADKESVTAIMAGLPWAAARKRSRELLVVRLVSERAPTPERWRSYGWTVRASPPEESEKRGKP
jgi:hypothetical protein